MLFAGWTHCLGRGSSGGCGREGVNACSFFPGAVHGDGDCGGRRRNLKTHKQVHCVGAWPSLQGALCRENPQATFPAKGRIHSPRDFLFFSLLCFEFCNMELLSLGDTNVYYSNRNYTSDSFKLIVSGRLESSGGGTWQVMPSISGLILGDPREDEGCHCPCC